MTKKGLDFTDVRKLCAAIAAKEEIMLEAKTKKLSLTLFPIQRKMSGSTTSNNEVVKLEEILLYDLSVKGRDGLMKRMTPVLRTLKTTDIETARAFLRLERYQEVRQNIIKALKEFVTKDLKMTIANSKIPKSEDK